MATKKDNLPLTLDQDNDSMGTITYANEVIAIIAGVAANEVDGVAAMCSSSSITDVFGRSKNVSKVTKGVKVELGTEEAAVDLYLIVEYGTPIQTCAAAVQENVRKSIESMTGLHVVRVDVHVQGVSFEKEQKALEGMSELPGLTKAEEAPKAEAPAEPVKPAEPVHVEFEGEPTPAEEHEPTAADLEMEAAKAEAEAEAAKEAAEESAEEE